MGNLAIINGSAYIAPTAQSEPEAFFNVPMTMKAVNIETLGQCTGIIASESYRGTEEKDLLVFEGDSVVLNQFLYADREIENELSGVIGYNDATACFTLKQIKNREFEEHTGYESGEGETELINFYGIGEESWRIVGTLYDEK